MTRTLICIGGGEIRSKETLAIDEQIALLTKEKAGEKRAVAVFVGTASHDSLPYFNSFRKTYTSHFDIKADLALLTKKDIPMDKIKGKLENADLIYIGGGNTIFMLETWKKTGFLDLLLEAYNRGVIVAGLSAGAICWFEKMYTDSVVGSEYEVTDGLGVIKGLMSPHYDNRVEFDEIAKSYPISYAVENKSAIVFEDETLTRTYTAGGNSYKFKDGIKIKI